VLSLEPQNKLKAPRAKSNHMVNRSKENAKKWGENKIGEKMTISSHTHPDLQDLVQINNGYW